MRKIDKLANKFIKFMVDLWTSFLRPFIIVAATMLILYFGVTKVVSYVTENYFLPPEPDNEETFTLEIPSGYGVRGISNILEENGVISNSFVFRLFVDVSNNSYKLQSGKYVFSKNMTMQEVMDQLLIGTNTVPTTNITLIEGWSMSRIASYLVNTKGLDFTEQEFIDYAKPENFPEYWFLSELPAERKQYGYELQGYLFPDTYSIYVDATPRDIIKKMLDNFQNKITNEMLEKASELGYTVDELITFASILEKEAAGKDEYARCAACFVNRINRNMALQSDATVIYAQALNNVIINSGFDISINDTQIKSDYNTYANKGLPIGPICNPGLAAIQAVLEPSEEDINAGMLYFTLNPDTGKHMFNSDYNLHVYWSKIYADRYKELQNQQSTQAE